MGIEGQCQVQVQPRDSFVTFAADSHNNCVAYPTFTSTAFGRQTVSHLLHITCVKQICDIVCCPKRVKVEHNTLLINCYILKRTLVGSMPMSCRLMFHLDHWSTQERPGHTRPANQGLQLEGRRGHQQLTSSTSKPKDLAFSFSYPWMVWVYDYDKC